MNSVQSDIKIKADERSKIAEEIDAYLKSGKKIAVIDVGETNFTLINGRKYHAKNKGVKK